jgi:hypothetical protein
VEKVVSGSQASEFQLILPTTGCSSSQGTLKFAKLYHFADISFHRNGAGGPGDNGKGIPANGKTPISTLQQATVDMGVSAAGVFSRADYFEPYEYASLDGGDLDFGSSGVALLSPYFSGGGVSQVVVAGGKSGKIYFMDANNLGGFATGTGGSDGGNCPFSQTHT